jgi:16S rRNA (cytosine1402-N4)-methyltransferase
LNTYHQPVLLLRVIELLLSGETSGWIVDGTLGGAGHSSEILKQSDESVRVLGIDRDPNALAFAQERLLPFGGRARLHRGRFCDVMDIVNQEDTKPVIGLLLDLGVSSTQLDVPERGFSFRDDGPLDMDMEDRGEGSALRLLQKIDHKSLTEALRTYGDIARPGTVARVIIEEIRASRIRSTVDLAELVAEHFPWLRKGHRHPATRVFQAIRMLVNEEAAQLQGALDALPDLLAPGGTAVIISYHSFEDRMVKNSFRTLRRTGDFNLLTRKPQIPEESETQSNPRARSAKLRAIQRT